MLVYIILFFSVGPGVFSRRSSQHTFAYVQGSPIASPNAFAFASEVICFVGLKPLGRRTTCNPDCVLSASCYMSIYFVWSQGRVCGYWGFSPQIEKEIIAGSDFFLMPSRPGASATIPQLRFGE